MLIKKATGIEIPASEITPKEIYLSRRTFMTGAAALAATAALVACGTPPAPAESNAAENSGGETSETAVAEGERPKLEKKDLKKLRKQAANRAGFVGDKGNRQAEVTSLSLQHLTGRGAADHRSPNGVSP